MKTHRHRRTLIVIDDDAIFCDAVREYFASDELEVLAAGTAREGLALCENGRADIVLLDQNLPDADGHACCPEILKRSEQAKIIFATAYPSYKDAVAAVKQGAHDYLSKPFELEELRLTVDRCLRTLDLELKEQVQEFKNVKDSVNASLVGETGLADVRKTADLAASVDAPVLITGETGTGKNVAAKYIHYMSPRKNGAFIYINCAALPETLIEAELFGHEKGAFTGAVSTRKGLFEMAEGGSLLLDEIGAMPLQLQSKLLGVLEDRMVRRLGGTTSRRVDVRVMASTNLDLEKAVGKKEFRGDLFYRLGVIRIHMPPLRERAGDIPELCRHILGELAAGRELSIPDDELSKLMRYGWPGNVRELKNILERACIIQKDNVLSPSMLLGRGTAPSTATQPPAGSFSVETAEPPSLRELEARYIGHLLSAMTGNVTRTAEALGVSRSTLQRKMKEYGIN